MAQVMRKCILAIALGAIGLAWNVVAGVVGGVSGEALSAELNNAVEGIERPVADATTVSVKGLPAGVKFDAKTKALSGTPTTPGTYTVDVTMTITKQMSITVANSEKVPLEGRYMYDGTQDFSALYADGAKVSVTGLPPGLKLGANGKITGSPTTPGEFTAVFTRQIGKQSYSSATTFEIKGTKLKLVSEGEGTVTGEGTYFSGKAVTLKATPAKGYVFAGWYNTATGEPLDGAVDYRTATYTYTVGSEDTELRAQFCNVEEDTIGDVWLVERSECGGCKPEVFEGETWSIEPNGSELNASLYVNSGSIPSVTVKGLPAGLKFDAKTLKITGKSTTPGVYTTTFTITNSTVKAANAKTFEITTRVLNIDELGYGREAVDLPVTLVAGVPCDGLEEPFMVNATASGLPAGLKWDSKTGTFSGTTLKPGTYTVTFTRDKKRTTMTFEIAGPKLTLVTVGEGTVTGSGTYYVGQKVTLKATPKKGYVFAGWWRGDVEADDPLAGSEDYRTPTLTYTMEVFDENLTVVGLFIPTAEDTIGDVVLAVGGDYYDQDLTWSLEPSEAVEAELAVDSQSLPKVTVKGLPTGLKFDAKTLKITGKATTPGVYTTTFTIANSSIPAAKAKTFSPTIRVLNIDQLGFGGKDEQIEVKAGEDGSSASRDLSALAGATVSGLPAGLKWDSKTGTLSGTTWKVGTYTATFTKKGEGRTTLTFAVVAMPPVVSDFRVCLSDSETSLYDVVDAFVAGEPWGVELYFTIQQDPITGSYPQITFNGIPKDWKVVDESEDKAFKWYYLEDGRNYSANTPSGSYTVEMVATDPKTGASTVTPFTIAFREAPVKSYGTFLVSGRFDSTISGHADDTYELVRALKEDIVFGSASIQKGKNNKITLSRSQSCVKAFPGSSSFTFSNDPGMSAFDKFPEERKTLGRAFWDSLEQNDAVRLTFDADSGEPGENSSIQFCKWEDGEEWSWVVQDESALYSISLDRVIPLAECGYELSAKGYPVEGVIWDGDTNVRYKGTLTFKTNGEATAALSFVNGTKATKVTLTGGIIERTGGVFLGGRVPKPSDAEGQIMLLSLGFDGSVELKLPGKTLQGGQVDSALKGAPVDGKTWISTEYTDISGTGSSMDGAPEIAWGTEGGGMGSMMGFSVLADEPISPETIATADKDLAPYGSKDTFRNFIQVVRAPRGTKLALSGFPKEITLKTWDGTYTDPYTGESSECTYGMLSGTIPSSWLPKSDEEYPIYEGTGKLFATDPETGRYSVTPIGLSLNTVESQPSGTYYGFDMQGYGGSYANDLYTLKSAPFMKVSIATGGKSSAELYDYSQTTPQKSAFVWSCSTSYAGYHFLWKGFSWSYSYYGGVEVESGTVEARYLNGRDFWGNMPSASLTDCSNSMSMGMSYYFEKATTPATLNITPGTFEIAIPEEGAYPWMGSMSSMFGSKVTLTLKVNGDAEFKVPLANGFVATCKGGLTEQGNILACGLIAGQSAGRTDKSNDFCAVRYSINDRTITLCRRGGSETYTLPSD